MTIASTETKTIYVGNGSTKAFAVPFLFLRDEDLEVTLSTEGVETPKTISTDYQLSGAGEYTGGVCTMTETPPAGAILVIRRNPPIVQEVDYVENDAFPASTHEAALDNLTMICQTLAERLDRTITFRVSTAVSGIEMPEPSAGRLIAWNETGNNLANKQISDFSAVEIPLATSQGGTGAETPDEALTNLGFGDIGKVVATAEASLEALAVLDAEQADTAILKSDIPELLTAVYGDEAQTHTGADLSALTIERNHVVWELTEASQFSDVTLPYDGTYVFHIYPEGNTLSVAAGYLSDGSIGMPSSGAGEIRIAVEQFNARKTIVSLQNMGG